MSRCFPYPPPGYVKKEVIRDEALIDSIKIQREDKKAKKEKKRERKREKKEKKARENGKLEDKHSHKKRFKEEEKDGGHGKKRKHETDNVDKSGLTEEHEQPVDSQNSSDSTVNSNKRQKQDLSPDGRQNSASVFRIRLPLQRHKDPGVLPKEEQPCQLPLQKHNVPVVQPRDKQPRQLLLQVPVVPPRDKQPCQLPLLPREKQFPLQKNKGPIVLPRENQPCQLSLQKHKDSVLVPREKQPCQLPLPKPKYQVVVLKEEQPCWLPPQRHKDAEASLEQPFRLSLQRHRYQKVLSREEQPCQLSLRKDKNKLVLPVQDQPCPSSVRADITCIQGTQEQAPKQGRYEVQPLCSTSGSAGKDLPSRPSKEKRRKSGGGSVSKTSEHSELFESWTLPPLVHILPMNVDDEEWWLETNQKRNCGADKPIVVNDSLSCGDSTSWPPHACRLPEADIYALPYTVPF